MGTSIDKFYRLSSFTLLYFIFINSSISFSQSSSVYQCAADKTPSGCPSTVALFKFIYTAQLKAERNPTLNNTELDNEKAQRLYIAADKEWRSNSDCTKGATACGLMEETQVNSNGNNGQINTGKTNQQIIADAQKLGERLKNSINKIETLKEGETIGNSERISEDKTTLKGLGSIDDWNPDDSQVKGFIYPDDAQGSNKALAQEMRYSVNALFASDHVDDDWEKIVAELFKDMLKAFSLGFTGLGEGLRSEIPESVHVNLTKEGAALKSLGTLDDKEIEAELKKYVENCQSIGYKEAFKKFMTKFNK